MIRKILFVPTVVLSTLFFSLVAVVGGLLRAPKKLHDWVHRNWSRSLLRVAGVRVRAEGLEPLRPDEPYVFVSNHQSFFDIWALMATLPASIRFVAKRELAKIPVFASACRAAGHVLIDRRDAAAAGRAIRAAAGRMESEGLSLVLFPEGTRSPSGRLRRFKKGSFALAIETQATLVPVAVEGGGRVLPKGARLPTSGALCIRCAPPVSLAGMDAGDRDRLVETTRARIASMLEELRPRDAPHVPAEG